MTRQLVFDLPHRAALGRDAFFVSRANAEALAAIDGWRDWPGGKLLLTGPEGAGKTHLAHVWASQSGAVVVTARDLAAQDIPALAGRGAVAVEDADFAALPAPPPDAAEVAQADRALFHLHNLLAAQGGSLLVTARDAPSRWPGRLPDLVSRMQAAPLARIAAADDALLAAVLVKLFADRQVRLPPAVIDFLLPRMDRSLSAAAQLVDRLDAHALATGRAIGTRLAGEVLDSMQDGSA
jgi:chromosomal replication initiation ATPase DnaA